MKLHAHAEVQPLETRSAGQSITTLVNLLFSFVIGQTYLTMLCAFKWGAPLLQCHQPPARLIRVEHHNCHCCLYG